MSVNWSAFNYFEQQKFWSQIPRVREPKDWFSRLSFWQDALWCFFFFYVCVSVAALSIIQCAVSLQLGVKLSCQRCLHNFPITEVDADGAWRPLGGSPRRLPARIVPAIHQHTSRAQSARQTLPASRQHGQPSPAYCCLGRMQREWAKSPSKKPIAKRDWSLSYSGAVPSLCVHACQRFNQMFKIWGGRNVKVIYYIIIKQMHCYWMSCFQSNCKLTIIG